MSKAAIALEGVKLLIEIFGPQLKRLMERRDHLEALVESGRDISDEEWRASNEARSAVIAELKELLLGSPSRILPTPTEERGEVAEDSPLVCGATEDGTFRGPAPADPEATEPETGGDAGSG